MAPRTKKQPSPALDFLDQSVWAQADQYLAKAFLDSERLCARLDKAQRKSASAKLRSLAAIEGDALLIRQAVTEAATLRGLTSFGKAGDICAFDPLRHELSGKTSVTASRSPKTVKIKTPGVLTSTKRGERVLVRAKAKAV